MFDFHRTSCKLHSLCKMNCSYLNLFIIFYGDRHGHDRMVVGFTTTYAISAYHHWCCEFESRSGRGVQHYVVKFISDFLRVFWFPPSIKMTTTI